MRHEISHPWISFRLNLDKASPKFWRLLGQAKSECQHVSSVPLKPAIADYMHTFYLARGVLATTAIEGNTLTEREALKVVKGNSRLPRSQQYLAKEIENILTAIKHIIGEIGGGKNHDIHPHDIKKYNEFILSGLQLDEHVIPGKYREYGIEVSTYIGPDCDDIEGLVKDFCAWMNGQAFISISDDACINAIIKAMIAHIYMAWIHPFGDGNGRTSRILEFRFLMEGGIPSPAAHLLSNYYNKTRAEYYRRLEEVSKNGGDLLPFLEYAVEGFAEELHEQLNFVRAQQLIMAWQNYVHEELGDKKNASSQRQLRFVLSLPISKHLSKNDVLKLNPDIARLYANKTAKTLSRDINKLQKLGLVNFENSKISARIETILNFLPSGNKDYFVYGFDDIEERIIES